ncbi:MAG: class I SAM-dependent methyltransferase [Deltaproteobacteria bacterium]|nr:class I SAM-dependent methyltransferase [Deltaproteobacteria bacterium]
MPEQKLIQDPEYGYLRLDPIPSLEVVERLYKEEYYAPDYKPFHEAGQKSKERDVDYNRPRYQQLLDIAGQKLGGLNGLRLYDLGCGFGGLLRQATGQGLEVQGCDLSPVAVDYVLDKGSSCHQANIELDFGAPPEQRFDLVTMLCVLQHLRHPAQTLFRVREELLTEDGVLVVEVPNEFNVFQTVADQEYNLGRWWVSAPEHIAYFTAQTIKDTLEGCGYVVFEMYASFPMELFLVMGDVYVGDQAIGARCHQRRVRFEELMRKHGKSGELLEFYRALARLGLGRQVTCLATPHPYTKKIEPKTLRE